MIDKERDAVKMLVLMNAIEPKFVSWAPGRRGFCRVTTTSRPASVWKPVLA